MDVLGGVFIIVVVILAITCISLGLLLAHVCRKRQNTTGQSGLTQAESTTTEPGPPQVGETQLDKIEGFIRRADLNNTRLWLRSLALTAIIFSGTGLVGVETFDTWARVVILVLGFGVLIGASQFKGKGMM